MIDQLKTVGAAFKREFQVYRCVLADRETPFVAKALLAMAVAYVLMPFDLIPDFLPLIGQLDDVIIVPALVWLALRFVPRELIDSCRTKVLSTTPSALKKS